MSGEITCATKTLPLLASGSLFSPPSWLSLLSHPTLCISCCLLCAGCVPCVAPCRRRLAAWRANIRPLRPRVRCPVGEVCPISLSTKQYETIVLCFPALLVPLCSHLLVGTGAILLPAVKITRFDCTLACNHPEIRGMCVYVLVFGGCLVCIFHFPLQFLGKRRWAP